MSSQFHFRPRADTALSQKKRLGAASRPKGTLVVTALLTLVILRASHAAVIQVGFNAVITSIYDPALYIPEEIAVGDSLVGYYTYELNATDQDPGPQRGYYVYNSQPNGIVVNEDSGWVFRTNWTSVNAYLAVGDSLFWGGYGPADTYTFKSLNNIAESHALYVASIQVDFVDSSLTALSDDSLPTDIPVLEDWSNKHRVLIWGGGETMWTIIADITRTGPEIPTMVPKRLIYEGHLGPNLPNPFNPITTIPFSIERADRVTLVVYDALGRHVRHLIDERLPVGDFKVQWDGHDDSGRAVASGTYFYRLTVGGQSVARKATLLK